MDWTDEFSDLMTVPWKRRGRDPRAGLDCLGLAIVALGRKGLTLPDYVYPDDERTQGQLIAELWHENFDRVDEPEPGDIARIDWHQDGNPPNHLGVYLGGPDGLILHMTHHGGMKHQARRLMVVAYYRLRR